jgi:hypothetical protein
MSSTVVNLLICLLLIINRRYHVNGQCSVGDANYNSNVAGLSEYGLFLNLADPVNCTAGHISSISYAYYSSKANNVMSTISITIWTRQSGEIFQKVILSSIVFISVIIL